MAPDVLMGLISLEDKYDSGLCMYEPLGLVQETVLLALM